MPPIEPVIVQAPMGDDPPTATLYYGADCRESLRRLPDQSVHMVCTSPPYWGLRQYGDSQSIWGGDKDCDHEWSHNHRSMKPNSFTGKVRDTIPVNVGSEATARGNVQHDLKTSSSMPHSGMEPQSLEKAEQTIGKIETSCCKTSPPGFVHMTIPIQDAPQKIEDVIQGDIRKSNCQTFLGANAKIDEQLGQGFTPNSPSIDRSPFSCHLNFDRGGWGDEIPNESSAAIIQTDETNRPCSPNTSIRDHQTENVSHVGGPNGNTLELDVIASVSRPTNPIPTAPTGTKGSDTTHIPMPLGTLEDNPTTLTNNWDTCATAGGGTMPPFPNQGISNSEEFVAGVTNKNCTHIPKVCHKCGAVKCQLGLEPSPYEFVEHLVEIFAEVKRVLRDDGTFWLNLGDSYANPGIQSSALSSTGGFTGERMRDGKKGTMNSILRAIPEGIKYKDLVGIPWRVAFALQADGWYLRQDIIWKKGNPMPESVTDRCTKAHEYIFLLTKKDQYFYDADAVREPYAGLMYEGQANGAIVNGDRKDKGKTCDMSNPLGRNKRSVWDCNTKPYRGAHFAVWPEDLVEPMILAGTGEKGCCAKCGASYKRVVEKEEADKPYEYKAVGIPGEGANRGQRTGAMGAGLPVKSVTWEPGCDCGSEIKRCVVLDPFSGSATTGKVANDHGRDYIGLDANTEYLDMAVARLQNRAAPSSDDTSEESSVMDLFG